jgi:enamine deaminase RidA (YjgF/YER057c/UK114 family)
MTANMATWANRLFVNYTEAIPPVEVRVLTGVHPMLISG